MGNALDQAEKALRRAIRDAQEFMQKATQQLKLEARGFEPQTIQVDPAQLNKPFKAVMQAKRTGPGNASSAK